MKRKCNTPEQIIRKLRTAEQLNQDQTVADVCRALEVSVPTYHHWQQLYYGMKTTEAKCLKELEPPLPAKLTPLQPTLFTTGIDGSEQCVTTARPLSWI